ncbi:MAG: flagellar filament capping protein FliD [Lachnospiraceae bacterium]|nr:flagellar filament capping protein FliD [Lachnospiraceae bacterium]
MTKTTFVSEGMLAKVGITIGSGNKLELDEDKLKEADISTLKTLFTGHNSYADKIVSKGNAIAMAASNAGGTYTSSGTYSSALSQVVSSKIDTKE